MALSVCGSNKELGRRLKALEQQYCDVLADSVKIKTLSFVFQSSWMTCPRRAENALTAAPFPRLCGAGTAQATTYATPAASTTR